MFKVEWRKYLAVCSCILLLFGLSFAAIFTNGEVRAHDVSYDVSINSMLGVTLPYNNIILDLNPYNKTFEHKGMSMLISTNSNAGYEMTLTSTGGATSLTDEQDNAKTIETLPVLAGGYNESDFVANKWGYSLNGANYQPFVSGATLAASTEGTSAAVSLDFASKVDYSQAPGSYSIELNFNAVGHISPLYMQNLSSDLCTATPILVADIRDEQQYYIQRLADGNCWMMTNLNLGGVDFTNDLNRYNTNISGVIEAKDFFTWKKNNSGGGTATLDAGEFYSQTGVDATSQTPYGTLYNYYAASAGTIKGYNNTSDATEDICPAGWRMPTDDVWSSGGFGSLYMNYNSNALMRASMANDGAAFTLSGMFSNGVPSNRGIHGFFWSSSSFDGTGEEMMGLGLDTTDVSVTAYNRGFGMAVRCILKDGDSSEQVIRNMQEFKDLDATQIATLLSEKAGVVYTLKDSRDNQEYRVAKLGDGRLWMLDNLRLGGDAAIELTPADTNIESNWTLPASGTVCFDSYTCTDTGGTSGNGYTRPAINADYKDTVASTTYGNGSGKYGVYYNYCAASAGTYCYASSSGTGDATQDICPAGWRMPTGGSSGEYKALGNIYTDTTATNTNSLQYNLSTPFSGYFYYRSTSDVGSGGYIWSSSYGSYSDIKILRAYSSSVDPVGSNDRYYGYSVRCVLNTDPGAVATDIDLMGLYGVGTMQDLSKLSSERLRKMESLMEIGKNYELKDSRDNQTYTIAKLGDGNIWMTQNLNLGASDLTNDLTPSDTNISARVEAGIFNGWRKDSGSQTYTEAEFISVPSVNYTLYNYCAVSAGSYCYDTESDFTNATQDICPAGWRLPTGGESSNFAALIRRGPLTSFGSAYSFSSGTPTSNGYYYWSSTGYSATSVYGLYHPGQFGFGTSATATGYRSNGHPVRCIFSEDRSTNMTLQDFGKLSGAERNLVISTMYTGKEYELKDSRDNQTYTIAKLADDNIWITRNLNLGDIELTQDLTPSNTNITTVVDAATFNGWKKTGGSNVRVNGEFISRSGINSDTGAPYGTLYNYCAASAGTYCLITNLRDLTEDICPAGWKIPTGSELDKLVSKYSSASTLLVPVPYGGGGFSGAGGFNYGTLSSTNAGTPSGTGAFYWTSTYKTVTDMNYVSISSSYARSSSGNRGSGFSIRCMLKQE